MAATSSRAVSGFGAAYNLRLSLLDGGDDRFSLGAADLVCIFVPADGRTPIRSSVHTIQVGRQFAASESGGGGRTIEP